MELFSFSCLIWIRSGGTKSGEERWKSIVSNLLGSLFDAPYA